jgi:hypothetical protein
MKFPSPPFLQMERMAIMWPGKIGPQMFSVGLFLLGN